MSDVDEWLHALRDVHAHLTQVLAPLDDRQITSMSYDSEWTIADVASHLGSQAEILERNVWAAVGAGPAPDGPAMRAIWDVWDHKAPPDQVRDTSTAGAQLVATLTGLTDEQRQEFTAEMFVGPVDLAGFASLRLGEETVHTWDIAVALDPAATLLPSVVPLLLRTLPGTATRVGKPQDLGGLIHLTTTSPDREFELAAWPEVVLRERTGAEPDGAAPVASVHLPAEALVRFVYGRLDPVHTPGAVTGAETLAQVRSVFPGV